MPQRDPDRPAIVTVREVVDETPTVRTLAFRDEAMSSALPGQFAMVWVPGVGELPMSVMVSEGRGMAAFTVRRHGHASTGLFNTGAGQPIGVRGPYGNAFTVRGGRLLLVGGGTGLVPLMRLLTAVGAGDDVTVLIGARSANEVFFERTAEGLLRHNARHRVMVCTEDGSSGRGGLVTDLAEELLDGGDAYDGVYTCGPEPMMFKTVSMAHSRGVFVQASVERMMKCGVGICGSCCLGEDLVCRDGTVFDGGHLLGRRPEFGLSFRNKSGIPEEYPRRPGR